MNTRHLIFFALTALPVATASAGPLDLEGVRRAVANKGFTIVIEPPFIVVGDEEADVVRTRAESTVRWASTKLKERYFTRDPKGIVVWLFKDAKSYRKHAWELFKDRPSTPYGYYSSTEKALIMNISTGGGTLVHEMVHPYVHVNFPDCPSWFNEGLGSLYEQSAERRGRIWGLTNWRLAGLKKAIRAGRVPTFKTLTHTTSEQFYDEDPGSNYSQSRYLLYYLQSKGKLQAFYRAFHKNQRADPTGWATLQRILDHPDMAAFQRDWERWVLTLTYP